MVDEVIRLEEIGLHLCLIQHIESQLNVIQFVRFHLRIGIMLGVGHSIQCIENLHQFDSTLEILGNILDSTETFLLQI